MESFFWTLEIQQQLSKHLDLLNSYIKYNMEIYLFGSAQWKVFPNDIDIAILYPYSSMNTAQIVRDETVSILQNAFSLTIDSVLLSYEEDSQICFLSKEHAMKIFPI